MERECYPLSTHCTICYLQMLWGVLGLLRGSPSISRSVCQRNISTELYFPSCGHWWNLVYTVLQRQHVGFCMSSVFPVLFCQVNTEEVLTWQTKRKPEVKIVCSNPTLPKQRVVMQWLPAYVKGSKGSFDNREKHGSRLDLSVRSLGG